MSVGVNQGINVLDPVDSIRATELLRLVPRVEALQLCYSSSTKLACIQIPDKGFLVAVGSFTQYSAYRSRRGSHC